MDLRTLDPLFVKLEAASCRDEARACLLKVVARPARESNLVPHTFVKTLALPYAEDVKPNYASEYPEHWARFKKIWDRLK